MELIKIANIEIWRFVWDYVNSNGYVVNKGPDALIVDPIDTDEFWLYIKDSGIRAASVFLTHEHFDHISGLNRLREEVKCTVYTHTECSRNIGKIRKNMSNVANIISEFNGTASKNKQRLSPFCCKPSDVIFDEKIIINWCDYDVVFISTPGHSPGSACMILNGSILFSGDTLLEIPTITRFPGGSWKLFSEVTIPCLHDLEGQIQYVLPGHGDGGKLEEMLQKNISGQLYV